MTPARDPGGDPDGALADRLAAYHEALIAGRPPDGTPPPPELAACLERLEQDRLGARAGAILPGRDIVFDPASGTGRFGRFLLRRELGRGGFGVVFQAWDPLRRREVALKVPRPEAFLTPALRGRFLREARAAAGLDHPNIVPVHETGSVGPVCYMASAYCEGCTLARWLQRQPTPVPARAAAALVATLADAMHHAHQRGVLHRDLKPANILLERSEVGGQRSEVRGQRSEVGGQKSEGGESTGGAAKGGGPSDLRPLTSDLRPRITDFGLARLETGGAEETSGGAVMGTPAYMAPEQADGRAGDVGPPTDVYALGAILYETLTGQPPFRGEGVSDTLERVRSQKPARPRRLRPDLPAELEAICLKCLRKAPTRRYPSARALADDLRAFLECRPVQAQPPGRLPWAIALIVVLGGVGLLVTFVLR